MHDYVLCGRGGHLRFFMPYRTSGIANCAKEKQHEFALVKGVERHVIQMVKYNLFVVLCMFCSFLHGLAWFSCVLLTSTCTMLNHSQNYKDRSIYGFFGFFMVLSCAVRFSRWPCMVLYGPVMCCKVL